jgi:hypothetical protein
MSRQSAFLKFFHDELEKSSATADHNRKFQAFKASSEKQINSLEKLVQALTKERDELRTTKSALSSELATTASNFDLIKVNNAKLAYEKKDLQLNLSKAKGEVTALHGEYDLITISRDQLAFEKATLEAKNKKLREEMHQKELLISNGAYMAFSTCLKQVEFLNPGVQLTYKGVHPLHEVVNGKLLDYANDPLICVDLNDLELESFDPHAPQAIPPELAEIEEAPPANTSTAPSKS